MRPTQSGLHLTSPCSWQGRSHVVVQSLQQGSVGSKQLGRVSPRPGPLKLRIAAGIFQRKGQKRQLLFQALILQREDRERKNGGQNPGQHLCMRLTEHLLTWGRPWWRRWRGRDGSHPPGKGTPFMIGPRRNLQGAAAKKKWSEDMG